MSFTVVCSEILEKKLMKFGQTKPDLVDNEYLK